MGIVFYIILIVVVAVAASALYMNSFSKRLCPNCRTMMSKKVTACPKCGKHIPLAY